VRSSLACMHCLEQYRYSQLRIFHCMNSCSSSQSIWQKAKGLFDLLSASRRVGTEVATNDSCPSASLSGAVGPSCCSSSSDSEAAYSAFLEDFWSRRSSDNGCESKEQGGREEHHGRRCAEVLIFDYTYNFV
jgi:hypothetical protein